MRPTQMQMIFAFTVFGEVEENENLFILSLHCSLRGGERCVVKKGWNEDGVCVCSLTRLSLFNLSCFVWLIFRFCFALMLFFLCGKTREERFVPFAVCYRLEVFS